MPGDTPPLMNLSWSLWKMNWKDVLLTAAVAAGLEAAAFCLFLYMFIQDPHRVLPIVGAILVVFWTFHVGISALHAYLITHSALAHAPPSGELYD